MAGSTRFILRPSVRRTVLAMLFVVAGLAVPVGAGADPETAPNGIGQLDCNGFSPIQQSVKQTGACTDVRGIYEQDGARFIDNGHYIGHDEPSLRFLSTQPGSGNNVTWTETLPSDPAAMPTVATPGSDVTHWFELSVAPWFGMALCNGYSYPQSSCKPNSDSNAPHGGNQGGGSSFLEVQFYPPGFAPFFDNISCDNTHWCASLHINDLECSGKGLQHCNTNCEEPTNFGFIQRNGVPTGPAGPQVATLATSTPNDETLLMNPGDKLRVHIFDASLTGGGNALEVHIDDLTTGQSGFMQASAANGFMATDLGNCKGIPFNYEPEYDTASPNNIVPWAALLGGILTEYEVGHFTPCTSLSNPAPAGLLGLTAGDPFFLTCNGPYETTADSGSNAEPPGGDAFCYPAGDTHTALNKFGIFSDPNQVTGCDNILAGGDIDFDGTPYRTDWPTGPAPTATRPGSFLQDQPTTNGSTYPQIQFETDAPASEAACSPATLANCTVIPPNFPGDFYPFFSQGLVGGGCEWEFGQVTSGANSFAGANQYGVPTPRFFGTDASGVIDNPNCGS
jgi:hypothetical protein